VNILIVTPYLPHPAAGHGTGVFMHSLLAQIAPRHRITLLSFCDREEERGGDALRALGIDLHIVRRARGSQPGAAANARLALRRGIQFLGSILSWKPYYVAKWRDARMARAVRDLTERLPFDIVQCEFAFMGQYASFAARGATVLHEHDVTYRPAYRRFRRARTPAARFLHYLEWCRWARYERRLVPRFDHVFTVTEQDRMLLRRLCHSERISYLPRGADTAGAPADYADRQPHSMLFIGTFHHQPNVDAALLLAEEILPLVAREYPDAVVDIIGADPPGELTARAAAEPRLKVRGYVDDVTPYLRRAAVFVAPLRFGGGVKLKIIHAMAEGIPVVTTRVGIEGIEGIGPGAAAVASTPAALAGLVCRLFADPALASHTGARGREAVARHYAWAAVAATLERQYAQIIARHKE